MLKNDWTDKYDIKKYINTKKKYIIAKGGDGTLLKAVNMFKHLKKPFFGIAAGTENFLMNDNEYVLSNAKYKKLKLIKIIVTYNKLIRDLSSIDNKYVQKTKEFQAFNDVFISEENGWIDFNCKDKDYILGKFKGSGLIISTPQGSTGLNKNNNGSILSLNSKYWSITGDKTNKKINYILKQSNMSFIVKSRGSVNVFIDGNNNKVKNVSKIEISQGETITIIFNNYSNFKHKRKHSIV